jgi:hypothetical protein
MPVIQEQISLAEKELADAKAALLEAVRRRELVGEPVGPDILDRVEQAERHLATVRDVQVDVDEKRTAAAKEKNLKAEQERHVKRLTAIKQLCEAGRELDAALVNAAEELDTFLKAWQAFFPLATPWQRSIVTDARTYVSVSIDRLFDAKLKPGSSLPFIFVSDKLNQLEKET